MDEEKNTQQEDWQSDMLQLKKGMYGSELLPTGELFGLHCGQARSEDKLAHHAGWYNQSGEKLGWGDLDSSDFMRISDGLNSGEIFIILSGEDSHGNFVKGGIINRDEEAPGIDYVAQKAVYAIVSGKFYLINPYGNPNDKVFQKNGISFELLTPDEMKNLIVPPTREKVIF